MPKEFQTNNNFKLLTTYNEIKMLDYYPLSEDEVKTIKKRAEVNSAASSGT